MCIAERVPSSSEFQAWMEKGLNNGGFLVCKFIFRVSSDGFPPFPAINFSSECQDRPPCRDETWERQMMMTVVMKMPLLYKLNMTPAQ